MRLRLLTAITGSLLTILTALACAAPAGAATSAGSVPQIHTGSVCKGVVSQGGWHATICAIVNQNDAQLDTTAQALITYTIRSGTLNTVSATRIYSEICSPFCGFAFGVRNNPNKTLNTGKSSFLSNAYYGPSSSQVEMAAVVVSPCVSWTNGQVACYNGTITSILSGL
jgi:hypothetical protein